MGKGKETNNTKSASAAEPVQQEAQPAAIVEESTESVKKESGKKKNEDKKSKKALPNKTLCKLAKKDYLKNHMKEYQALVSDGEYVCKKCGRVAKNKRSLCSPARLG